jgi:RimJ/RimL family protein N-acetyltransferase
MIKSPFHSFRMPRRIEHDGIRLRPLRFLDALLISRKMNVYELAATAGPGKPVMPSSLEIWWWLKKTFPVFFCIDVASKCVGFIGVHSIEPGESAEVTLVVFRTEERRCGYGSRAYAALVSSLRRASLAKVIIARVRTDNHPSLSFWKKLGFNERYTRDGIKCMAKDLRAQQGINAS